MPRLCQCPRSRSCPLRNPLPPKPGTTSALTKVTSHRTVYRYLLRGRRHPPFKPTCTGPIILHTAPVAPAPGHLGIATKGNAAPPYSGTTAYPRMAYPTLRALRNNGKFELLVGKCTHSGSYFSNFLGDSRYYVKSRSYCFTGNNFRRRSGSVHYGTPSSSHP